MILLIGGEGGIRTPDTVARMPHFECGAFNHSATSPQFENVRGPSVALCVAAARAGDKGEIHSAGSVIATLDRALSVRDEAAARPISSAPRRGRCFRR